MKKQTSSNLPEILKAYDARNAAEIAEVNQKAARAKEVAAIMEKNNELAKAYQERTKARTKGEHLPYRLAILLATPLTKEFIKEFSDNHTWHKEMCGNNPKLWANALSIISDGIVWEAEVEAAKLMAADDLAAEAELAEEEAAEEERRAIQEEEEEYFYNFGKRMPTDHDDARQTYNDNIAAGLKF
jgi:hypothetical protein